MIKNKEKDDQIRGHFKEEMDNNNKKIFDMIKDIKKKLKNKLQLHEKKMQY